MCVKCVCVCVCAKVHLCVGVGGMQTNELKGNTGYMYLNGF